jgi:formate-dependent nitrite reductase cytochrome c552 subunit
MVIVGLLIVAACDREVTYTEETTTPESCFGCHSDQNTALVAAEGQWSYSKHASGLHVYENSETCARCHTSEGFVRKVNGEPAMAIENPTAIHCFTCHAPHSTGNLALRLTAPQALMNGESFDFKDGNICTACHQSRRNVNTYVAVEEVTMNNRYGPHYGVQADMLIGTNGFEYDGYSYEQTNHKGATDNGCLDCHFETPFGYPLGGHSFNMAYETETGETYNAEACAKCHDGIEEGDNFDLDGVQSEVATLIQELEDLLITADLLEESEEGLLAKPRTVGSRSEPGDSAGALWNYFLAKYDRSKGVHNREYITGLLESSIQFLEGEPGFSAPAVAEVKNPKAAR